MNQKNKNLKFKKRDGKTTYKNNRRNPQQQRELIKSKLIEKYNISSNEAERVLLKIENNNLKTNKNANTKNVKSNVNSEKKSSLIKNNDNIKVPQKLDTKQEIQQNNNPNKPKKTKQNPHKNIINKNQNNNTTVNNKKRQDVDEIISDIIPDYNKSISIELNHVDLTFEVDNEKIDTIKENIINFLEGNSKEKIKIHALDDISFKIYKGEKVGIVGYNGAGKSTLLKVISGIYPPDKGSVKTHGNISPLLSLGAGFDYNFSGRQNIMLSGAVLGYEKEFLEKKMDEIIEFSELGEYIDIPIKNYSSGMLAKLGFSIATAVDPDILIIDEVLGVGDVNFQKKRDH